MREFFIRIGNAVTTKDGVIIVCCITALIGMGVHSFWVCTNLAKERLEHKLYIETTANNHTQLVIAALHEVRLATQAQTDFTKEMRRELALREQTIVNSASRLEGITMAVINKVEAIDFQLREFRKAALAFYRKMEDGGGN